MTPDPAGEEVFSIEGIMVAGHPGQVRLLIGETVFDLHEDDVVSAEELPAPPGLVEDLAQPVRLVLRRGARLLGAGTAEAYEDVVWRRGTLFAVATRREQPPWPLSESFQQLEQQFFASYGIGAAEALEQRES